MFCLDLKKIRRRIKFIQKYINVEMTGSNLERKWLNSVYKIFYPVQILGFKNGLRDFKNAFRNLEIEVIKNVLPRLEENQKKIQIYFKTFKFTLNRLKSLKENG